MTDRMAEFKRERLAALRSLDEATIRAYSVKWGAELPPTQTGFWGGVHKARLVLPEFTEEERAVSRAWLIDHGLSPEPGLPARLAGAVSRRVFGR